MKKFAGAAAALAASTTLATAGGLDRSGQSVLAIFDDPNTYSFSLGYVSPSVTGSDVSGSGNGSYDAGGSYTQLGLSYANQINDKFSYALIFDQPYGADILYNGDPTTTNLGGTKADLSSNALTFMGKFQVNDRFSVFGGIRAQRVGGEIALNGLSYASAVPANGVAGAINAATGANLTAGAVGGALQAAAISGAGGTPSAEQAAAFTAVATAVGGPANFASQVATPFSNAQAAFNAGGGYSVDIEQTWGVGGVIGFAYEIPDIALRFALTYSTEVSHDASTREVLGPIAAAGGAAPGTPLAGNVRFSSPQSVNLEFQTGIAKDTLLLASMRWTDWDDFDVVPQFLGADLANIDDSYRWNVGVARRFNENFVGSVSLTYEKDNGSATVSPLGPNDGQIGLTIGGRYQKDNLTVTGGINYTKLGDAFAGVGGQPVALFEGSSVLGLGFRVNYKF